MLQMEADVTLCLVLFLVRAPAWDASVVKGTYPSIALTVQAHKIQEMTFMRFHLVSYLPIGGHDTLKRLTLLSMCFIRQGKTIVEKLRWEELSFVGWLGAGFGHRGWYRH